MSAEKERSTRKPSGGELEVGRNSTALRSSKLSEKVSILLGGNLYVIYQHHSLIMRYVICCL